MSDPVSDLFYELVDLTPAERGRVFEKRGVPPEIRAEVESLLKFDSGQKGELAARVSMAAEEALHAGGRE
jgi:hypothetical protein